MRHSTALLLALLCFTTGAHAQELSDRRWEEPSFGLSFLLPRDVKTLENTTDDARIKFLAKDFDLSLFITKTGVDTEVIGLKTAATAKLAYPYPDMVKIEDAPIRVGDRPAWRLYHAIPHSEQGDFVIGQVFIKIDPTNFAVLQFQCDNQDYDRVAAMFQAVLDSVAFADIAIMKKRRAAMIQETEDWKKDLGFDGLRAGLIPEQWFRIVESEQDIGYIRITQRESQQLGQHGIELQIRLRINEGDVLLDQQRDFFLAEDGTTEIWSIRGTRRIAAANHALPEAVGTRGIESWLETGLASDILLTVDQTSDAAIDRDSWQRPDTGYLSQIESILMPRHLAGLPATTFGFYAYYSNTHSLSLWTRELVPLENGAYLVIERPSPEVGQRRLTYDADGRLRRMETADGRVILSITREQIKKLYDIE